MCCTEPMHFILPATIMPIFVERAYASSMEWVVSITEDRLRLVVILEITDHMNLLALGSIPVEGSSKNTIGGFPNMAHATDNYLLLPPLKVPDNTPSNCIRSISTSFY